MRSSESGPKGAVIKSVVLNAIIIFAVSAVFLVGSVGAAGSALLSGEVFLDGTTVDGTDLSGLTLDEGREKLEAHKNNVLESLSVELDYDGNKVALGASDLQLDYDVEAALAVFPGNGVDSGSSFIDCIRAILSPGADDKEGLPLIYDREEIISVLEEALSRFDRAPRNAEAVFDENGQLAEITEDSPGRKAKLESTADALISSLEKNNSSKLTVDYDIIGAEITRTDLEDGTALLAQFETPLSEGDSIDSLCEEINGTQLPQGETLSLLERLSGLAEADGSHESAADKMAGGLYNAALLADLEIVERHAHEEPQDYLPLGLDAVIDAGDGRDLVIKNSTGGTIYITALADSESGILTLRLYGAPPEDGARIEISSEIIEELRPAEEIIELTYSLSPGEKVVVEPGRTGYEVAVHRKVYRDGSLAEDEIIYHDFYASEPESIRLGIDRPGK